MIIIKVIRSEIHIIRKNHKLYEYCDGVCFRSKSLYNYANYIARKEFIENHKLLTAFDLNKQLKGHESFLALPAKTSQMIIIKLGKNWKSYFRSIKDWSKNKTKYNGMPKLPKYKNKDGRFIAFFDKQQIRIRNGSLFFQEGRGIKTLKSIPTKVKNNELRQVQIIPFGNCYKISIIYHKEILEKIEYNKNYLSIDLGVNNLATLTNNIGLKPIVINGKILKSKNNYYNKLLSEAMSYIGTGISHRTKRINNKRNNIIENHMHQISCWLINYCLKNKIENIVIGRNKDWQRNSNIARKNNQMFAQIPFENLINKIQYKAEENGINIIIITEEYTSKSSFIDNDIIPEKYGKYKFSGKRIKRGLYKSKSGIILNADVNSSYNILRKCIPGFIYNDRIKGVSLHPVRINI